MDYRKVLFLFLNSIWLLFTKATTKFDEMSQEYFLKPIKKMYFVKKFLRKGNKSI